MRLITAALPLMLALSACQPTAKPPVVIMALVYNNAGKLGPKQTTLEYTSSVANLTGSAVNFVGSASIVIDPMDPVQQALPMSPTEDQVADAFLVSRGSGVRANLIDKGGVLWPADFHSWNMVSSYWNFEQAFDYFVRIYSGESTDLLGGANVLYWGDYQNRGIADPTQQTLTDNIIYYSPVRSFLIAPFDKLQKVPVSMNVGIIGHEFAHRVFNQKAFGNQVIPAELSWDGAPLNILKGLDEGLADLHGYGVTCSAKEGPGCDTEFLLASFDKSIAEPRDFSRDADTCMSVELRTAINNLDSNLFLGQGKQYALGTLFAAALYQASNKGGKVEVMQKALVRAYDDSATQTPGFHQVFQANLSTPEAITLERMSDIILSHITDPTLAKLACSELWDRLDLQPSATNMPHCPNTANRGTSCTPLPPP